VYGGGEANGVGAAGGGAAIGLAAGKGGGTGGTGAVAGTAGGRTLNVGVGPNPVGKPDGYTGGGIGGYDGYENGAAVDAGILGAVATGMTGCGAASVGVTALDTGAGIKGWNADTGVELVDPVANALTLGKCVIDFFIIASCSFETGGTVG